MPGDEDQEEFVNSTEFTDDNTLLVNGKISITIINKDIQL